MMTVLVEAYGTLWCLQWLVTLLRYHEWDLRWRTWPAEQFVGLIVAPAFVFRRWELVAAAHVAFLATKAIRQPFQYNSDIWCAILDATVLARGLSHGGWGTREGREHAAKACAATGCVVLGVLYTAAGLYKLNTSHLTTATSCSTLFYASLTDAYGIPTPAKLSGWITAAVETAIGAFLLTPWRRCGAALGVVLHAGIAVTPEPNNVVAFGAMMVPRYFFAAPEPIARVLARRPESIMIVALAVMVACAPPPARSVMGLVLAVSSLVVLRGLSSRRDGSSASPGWSSSRTHRVCALAAVAYALLPILGLQDMGNCHMFANLRVVGGGNHLFAPLGLLQRWRPGGPRSPFAGGVVAVFNTTNAAMSRMYPCEQSLRLREGARSLARAYGHSGREFIPLEARVHGAGVCRESQTVPYVMHALELRRLLAEARGQEHFQVVYGRLPDVFERISLPTELLRHDSEAGCVFVANGTACPPDAPSELGWPPTGGLLASLVTKLLVFNPTPVVADHGLVECCDG